MCTISTAGFLPRAGFPVAEPDRARAADGVPLAEPDFDLGAASTDLGAMDACAAGATPASHRTARKIVRATADDLKSTSSGVRCRRQLLYQVVDQVKGCPRGQIVGVDRAQRRQNLIRGLRGRA